ncbi:DUF6992 family protein [Chitinophagaceae bacterium MMS25-I14]
MQKIILLSVTAIVSFCASAQQRNTSAFDSLNTSRIKTNETGMKVLGAWSVANIITGVPGCFIAKDKEWKSFHGMNTAWGVVNLGISAMGFMGARKELQANYTATDGLHRYEANKRLFLINAGLDVSYVASGALLLALADKQTDAATCRGFGKSVIMQGLFLLIFDGTMYTAHQRRDSRWYRTMQHICISGNGIGVNYVIR